jgi:Amidohydrolase family
VAREVHPLLDRQQLTEGRILYTASVKRPPLTAASPGGVVGRPRAGPSASARVLRPRDTLHVRAGRPDLATALRLITSDDAFASLEEKRRGRIERGDYADLTVIRENLFELPQDCIAAATVLMTITNGQIAFEGEHSCCPPSLCRAALGRAGTTTWPG